MKKILFIVSICLICLNSVFSQSKKKWEKTQTLNSILAYEDFLKKYPEGKYSELAKQGLELLEFLDAKQLSTVKAYEDFLRKYQGSKNSELAKHNLEQLEFQAATKQNTVAAFEDFIKMTSNEQFIADAKSQIEKIRAEEALFIKAKGSNTIAEISSFIYKYPYSVFNKEANIILEKLNFEQSIADGSLIELNSFLKKYPKSKYASKINQKIPTAELAEAISSGTDDALITFIKSHQDAQLIGNAILKLKTFQKVDISKTIPWESLKTVYCGSAESDGKKYLCGINFNAFNPGINEISFRSVMAGPFRYYEPDVASLIIFDWTEFDGYFVKSTNLNHQTSDLKSFYTKASVKIDGLLFEPNSIVLRKINNNELMDRKKK